MIYNKILAMTPTFNRSTTYLPAFVNSAIEMSDPTLTEFCFRVHREDEATRKYLEGFNFKEFKCEILVEEPLSTINLAKFFNQMYDKTRTRNERETVVSLLGDDMVFKTKGWDRQILDLINAYKGIGVFWVNDDFIARERCPVNMFVTRDFVEATEHPFMCEEFPADFIDYIWGKVGKYTHTQHFLPDVHIQHNHNSRKPKEQWDDTFQKMKVAQEAAWKIGKVRAKQIAHEIADILIKKGMTGDSC